MADKTVGLTAIKFWTQSQLQWINATDFGDPQAFPLGQGIRPQTKAQT